MRQKSTFGELDEEGKECVVTKETDYHVLIDDVTADRMNSEEYRLVLSVVSRYLKKITE